MEAPRSRVSGGALAVLAAAAFVLGFRLSAPPTYVHDECYEAFTAHRYALGDREAWNPRASRAELEARFSGDVTPSVSYEWVHPPSARMIMAGFISLFGFKAVGYRLGSVLFGLLTLLMMYYLARRFRGERFAVFAVLVLASDGLFFVMSRVAMNDIYAAACVLAAMSTFHLYWTETGRRTRHLLLSGALFGLGVSMKWTAAPPFLGCLVLALGRQLYDRRLRGLPLWALAYLVLPTVVYLASYSLFFLTDHSWQDFVRLNHEIWYYHQHLQAIHARSSLWFYWPLDYKPVWFYSQASDGQRREIYAMGNPLVWWPLLPALAWTAVRFVRRRSPADGLILCGFCGTWLPWAFVGRATFLQYLLPAVPFGVLATVSALGDLEALWSRRARAAHWLLPAYAGACTLLFIYFYPIWSALPVSAHAYFGRRWFWFAGWR